jgi:hypothetical protein
MDIAKAPCPWVMSHVLPLNATPRVHMVCVHVIGFDLWTRKREAPKGISNKYDGQDGTSQLEAGKRPSKDNMKAYQLSDRGLMAGLGAKCTCKTQRSCKHLLFTHEGTNYDTDVDGLRDLRWA